MMTMAQIIKNIQTEAEEVFYNAILNARDKADVVLILDCKQRIDKPKGRSLREIRQNLGILKCYAERE